MDPHLNNLVFHSYINKITVCRKVSPSSDEIYRYLLKVDEVDKRL